MQIFFFNHTACFEFLKLFCHKSVTPVPNVKKSIEKIENKNILKEVHINQSVFEEWGAAGKGGQRRKSEHRNKQHNRIM